MPQMWTGQGEMKTLRRIAGLVLLLFVVFVFPGGLVLEGLERNAIGQISYRDPWVLMSLILAAVFGVITGVTWFYLSQRIARKLLSPRIIEPQMKDHVNSLCLGEGIFIVVLATAYYFSSELVKHLGPECFTGFAILGYVVGSLIMPHRETSR